MVVLVLPVRGGGGLLEDEAVGRVGVDDLCGSGSKVHRVSVGEMFKPEGDTVFPGTMGSLTLKLPGGKKRMWLLTCPRVHASTRPCVHASMRPRVHATAPRAGDGRSAPTPRF